LGLQVLPQHLEIARLLLLSHLGTALLLLLLLKYLSHLEIASLLLLLLLLPLPLLPWYLSYLRTPPLPLDKEEEHSLRKVTRLHLAVYWDPQHPIQLTMLRRRAVQLYQAFCREHIRREKYPTI
jgi:hypothetical protein